MLPTSPQGVVCVPGSTLSNTRAPRCLSRGNICRESSMPSSLKRSSSECGTAYWLDMMRRDSVGVGWKSVVPFSICTRRCSCNRTQTGVHAASGTIRCRAAHARAHARRTRPCEGASQALPAQDLNYSWPVVPMPNMLLLKKRTSNKQLLSCEIVGPRYSSLSWIGDCARKSFTNCRISSGDLDTPRSRPCRSSGCTLSTNPTARGT
jgi:hypothetical protein